MISLFLIFSFLTVLEPPPVPEEEIIKEAHVSIDENVTCFAFYTIVETSFGEELKNGDLKGNFKSKNEFIFRAFSLAQRHKFPKEEILASTLTQIEGMIIDFDNFEALEGKYGKKCQEELISKPILLKTCDEN